MKNRLELIRILDKKREYDSFSNQYKNECLHKVHVIIDDKLWRDIAILEIWTSDLGSAYCTVGDWKTKQPSTIKEFYNIAKWAEMICLDVNTVQGTIIEPISGIEFKTRDIL